MVGNRSREPESLTRICVRACSIIFCEAVAIYGIIVAIILQTKIDWVEPSPETGLYSNEVYFAGYAILGSGLTAGWANLACGCANFILAKT